jgi:hypothetical protein
MRAHYVHTSFIHTLSTLWRHRRSADAYTLLCSSGAGSGFPRRFEDNDGTWVSAGTVGEEKARTLLCAQVCAAASNSQRTDVSYSSYILYSYSTIYFFMTYTYDLYFLSSPVPPATQFSQSVRAMHGVTKRRKAIL